MPCDEAAAGAPNAVLIDNRVLIEPRNDILEGEGPCDEAAAGVPRQARSSYVSLFYYPHTTILLYMCPHTTILPSMCPHTSAGAVPHS